MSETRIIIEDPIDNEEEVIIRVKNITPRIHELLSALKNNDEQLVCYSGNDIVMIDTNSIFYFESVDNKTFVYCENDVYEIRMKLYELEDKFKDTDFVRVSKSVILRLSKVRKFIPTISSRMEALLKNNEKIVISRQYVPIIKEKLGGK